jgi:hypothetical protein
MKYRMLLKVLIEIPKKVGAPSKKKEKVSLLAHFFQQARGKEIALAACYLSGQFPQDRLGIGWATLQEALKDLEAKRR